ncbi:hypothetical protein ACN20G_27180 (plasmid) [Streptomyces sp. BI20]
MTTSALLVLAATAAVGTLCLLFACLVLDRDTDGDLAALLPSCEEVAR